MPLASRKARLDEPCGGRLALLAPNAAVTPAHEVGDRAAWEVRPVLEILLVVHGGVAEEIGLLIAFTAPPDDGVVLAVTRAPTVHNVDLGNAVQDNVDVRLVVLILELRAAADDVGEELVVDHCLDPPLGAPDAVALQLGPELRRDGAALPVAGVEGFAQLWFPLPFETSAFA